MRRIDRFSDSLDTIQVIIGGTSKRLELFEEAQKRVCARDNKVFKKLSFIKPATTRWNERQRQAERYLETHVRDAIEAINAPDLFTSGSSQEKVKLINKFTAAKRKVASLAAVALKVLEIIWYYYVLTNTMLLLILLIFRLDVATLCRISIAGVSKVFRRRFS